jgi:hypothetical protein
MLLLGVIDNAQQFRYLGFLPILISLGWIFYTPKYIELFLENRWQYFFVNSLQIIFSVFAYTLIIIISIAVFPDFGKLPAWIGCLVALIVFTMCQLVIFVPAARGDRKIVLPPNFKQETTPAMGAAFVLAAVFTVYTLTMPQLNYKIGGAALRAFHVGGDVPVIICLKTKPAKAISQRFVFDEDYCSEKLSMKLDSGDRVYISKFESKSEADGKNPSPESDAIYFRQDEIKQKIYVRKVVQEKK